jgi:hypothetical protein
MIHFFNSTICLFALSFFFVSCSDFSKLSQKDLMKCKSSLNSLQIRGNLDSLTIDSCKPDKSDKTYLLFCRFTKTNKRFQCLLDSKFKIGWFDLIDSFPSYSKWVNIQNDSTISLFERKARGFNDIVSGGLHRFNLLRHYDSLTIVGFLSVSDNKLKNGMYLDPYVDLVFNDKGQLLRIGRFYF